MLVSVPKRTMIWALGTTEFLSIELVRGRKEGSIKHLSLAFLVALVEGKPHNVVAEILIDAIRNENWSKKGGVMFQKLWKMAEAWS